MKEIDKYNWNSISGDKYWEIVDILNNPDAIRKYKWTNITHEVFEVETECEMSLKGMRKGVPFSEEHKNALKKPKAKQLWLTGEGKIVEMTLNNKNRFHPEWIQINK